MNEQKRILAVDDEPSMRRLLEIGLRQAGYQPLLAANGREALDLLRQQGADLIVSDLHMPGMGGLDLLRALRNDSNDIPVIIVTAQGEIGTAVDAMKLGASDYILRPFDLDTLEIAIDRALSLTRLKLENQFLRDEVERDASDLIGDSAAMQRVKRAIQQVAPEKATAMIVGETGTGKELVARAIHQLSPRKDALFVAVNCAAIPGEMLESELFGHARGAFTGAIKDRVGKFELADGGTLFLDEVTEMPIALQAKLLRALQEGVIERLGSNRPTQVDIRIIAATNLDPLQAVKDGKLREDLYYRLNVFRIEVPPLRQRLQDIPQLAAFFLRVRQGQISSDSMQVLQSYHWPGNVRELQNVLERAAIVSGQQTIAPEHLPADLLSHSLPAQHAVRLETEMLSCSLPDAIEALELRLIKQALQQSGDNKSRAAKLLEISERSLWYKLGRYKIGS
ncbi:sigma-54-dependent Fis family transcriptional regulator [Pseudomethylobacillus aquaticus]|uniref:Sigma-54-dependent Fis family transcriptional regulator n=1 Tax=Pseudomethylobacillus aquaticus TaxID=2676064 RepID=A0A3N0V6I6_9PROT|nr:sigma-54 dependent transcriptional regulator [Pseudomethylobacillus aquaticus]ROH88295.1 sigma-54-dependent Fis family transcriptional regulator [Pseudomethylobacillus aquaticus]